MDVQLDHIAVAVNSIDVAQKIYEDLGLHFEKKREVVTSQKVETAFAKLDSNAKLELLCPINSEGPIQKFLETKGPGIHHICLNVNDIEAKSKELVNLCYKLIYENPQVGAHNCMVNFVHPKSTGGVLIELSQRPGE